MEYINWSFLSLNLISLYRHTLISKYVSFAKTENILQVIHKFISCLTEEIVEFR